MRDSVVGVFVDNGFSGWDNLQVRMYLDDAISEEYSLRLVILHTQAACEVVGRKPRSCFETVWPPEIHHLVSALARANQVLVKETEGAVHVA